MEPGYDAYGWLVWGRQTLHWNLDTNGAPSWKPLTFLLTLPYAPFGRTQPWLWMVIDVTLTLAGCVFAARIAYRLTGPSPSRRLRPDTWRGAFAGLALLGIDDYWHQIVIANSDQIDVTLCLAAIDCHLCRRPQLAFGALVLASLGRPEAWPFAGLYAIWLWRAMPRTRITAVVGIASIPLLWFGVSALTAKSWLRAGDLALNSANVIHGNKFTGVAGRLIDLYTLPMQIAVGLALVLAAVLRDQHVADARGGRAAVGAGRDRVRAARVLGGPAVPVRARGGADHARRRRGRPGAGVRAADIARDALGRAHGGRGPADRADPDRRCIGSERSATRSASGASPSSSFTACRR